MSENRKIAIKPIKQIDFYPDYIILVRSVTFCISMSLHASRYLLYIPFKTVLNCFCS